MTNTGHDLSHAAVQERYRAIRNMTQQGRTAAEISTALHITPRSVQRARRKLGLTKPAPPRLTPEEIALAKQLLDDGASIAEAAATIGRSTHSLHRRFPEYSWDRNQIVQFAVLIRRTNAALNRRSA